MFVRAPLLFREYWRNPEGKDAVLQDGWFRTGDRQTACEPSWGGSTGTSRAQQLKDFLEAERGERTATRTTCGRGRITAGRAVRFPGPLGDLSRSAMLA
ncbi:hypothetical protein ACI2L4_32620 [Streptomyces sparsogenes]|uniref:hypothetical protein n=1 Tax=Streptomyces sparsogenes TaxID=67365 RepID=UPI0033E7758C